MVLREHDTWVKRVEWIILFNETEHTEKTVWPGDCVGFGQSESYNLKKHLLKKESADEWSSGILE